MSRPIVLPGGRFAVEQWRDLPRMIAAAAWLLGPRARRVVRSSCVDGARAAERKWAQSAAKWLDLELIVDGLDNIDETETYVVAPLHEGFADVIALLCLPLRLRFVARGELATWRVLGSALESGGHPMVSPERGSAAYRTIRRAAPAILGGGDCLVVFPQGAIVGVEAAFTAGAFRLSAATGRPLLPIVITGSHRVWEHPFTPIVRFGCRVHMAILEPIEPQNAVAEQAALERRMKEVALAADAPARRYVPERDGWWDGYRFDIDPHFSDLAERVAAHRLARDSSGS